jgi:drug/metabolite transporter (DMT)-like permease
MMARLPGNANAICIRKFCMGIRFYNWCRALMCAISLAMTPPLQQQNDRHALGLATLGILCLTIMDAVIKSLAKDFSAFENMTFRHGVGIVCTGALFLVLRPGWPNLVQARKHALRSLIMLATGLMFFHALGKMPLAELFIYTFTAPFFVVLFGTFILKERLAKGTLIGIALGFSGMLAIFLTGQQSTSAPTSWDGQLAAVLSPVTYALAMVLLRSQASGEPVTRVIFMQSLIVCAVLIPLIGPSLPLPTSAQLWKIVAAGVIGSAGNLLLTMGFARADASKVIVTEYTGLIWAALIGFAYFSEVPRAMVWIGGALVIAGCYVVLRNKRPANQQP